MTTRALIEQAIGILKRRFPCLHTELRVKPEKCAKIIVSAVILHNIAVNNNDELPLDADIHDNRIDESDDDNVYDRNDGTNRNGPVSQPEARRLRDSFARAHFT